MAGRFARRVTAWGTAIAVPAWKVARSVMCGAPTVGRELNNQGTSGKPGNGEKLSLRVARVAP